MELGSKRTAKANSIENPKIAKSQKKSKTPFTLRGEFAKYCNNLPIKN